VKKIVAALLALATASCGMAWAQAPSLCVVSGTVVDSGAQPVPGATVRMRTIQPALVGNAGIAAQDITVKTANDGTWSISVIQGLNAQMDIRATSTQCDLQIPTATTATIGSLTCYSRGTLTPATILSDHGPSFSRDLSGSSPDPYVVGLRGYPLYADVAADGKGWVYSVADGAYRLQTIATGTKVGSVTAGTAITLTGTATAPVVNVTTAGITSALLASGAAATNVGTLGGRLTGTLPNPGLVDFVGSGTGHANGAVPDPGSSAGTTRFLREDGGWAVPAYPTAVTSVGLALPNIFTVTNSPVTTTGTLTGTLASQTANLVFASPNGSTGAPTFRALVGADMPDLSTFGTGILGVVHGGTGRATLTANTYLMGNGTSAVASSALLTDNGTVLTDSGALTVTGLTTATGGITTGAFTLTTGAGAGKILTSDSGGVASWATATSISGLTPSARTITTTAPMTIDGGASADLSANRTLAVAIFVAAGASHAAGLVPDPGATTDATKFLRDDASWRTAVTSVTLTAPAQFTVAGSPLTTSGTLALDWASQAQAKVLAAPASGSGPPTFRLLAGSDIPPFTGSGPSHTTGGVPDPGSSPGTLRFLREDGVWAIGTGSGSVLGINAGGTGNNFPTTTPGDAIVVSDDGTKLVQTGHIFLNPAGPNLAVDVPFGVTGATTLSTLGVSGAATFSSTGAFAGVLSTSGAIVAGSPTPLADNAVTVVPGSTSAVLARTDLGHYSEIASSTSSQVVKAVSDVYVSQLIATPSDGGIIAVSNPSGTFKVNDGSPIVEIIGMGLEVGTSPGTPLFAADASTGDAKIHGVAYVWPSANAAGNLANDGAGNLTWVPTLVPVMQPSGPGHASGLTPDTPSTVGTVKYLREDGTWAIPPGGTGSSPPFTDDTEVIENLADVTKKLRFDLTGVPTSTTVVATVPASNFTFARTDAGQTFTGIQSFGASLNVNGVSGLGYIHLTAQDSITTGSAGGLNLWATTTGLKATSPTNKVWGLIFPSGSSEDYTFPAYPGNVVVSSNTGGTGQCLIFTGGAPTWGSCSGSTSVTSVGISAPAYMTVGSSPITSSGTIALDFAVQSGRKFHASPADGSSGALSMRALVAADYPTFVASGASHAGGAVPDPGASAGTTKYLREDATFATAVSSVALSGPAELSVGGSPVTTSGTLALTWASASGRKFIGSPADGSSGAYAGRALVPADYPVFVASGASHAAGAVPDPGASAGSTKFLREDGTWATPAGSGSGTVTSVALAAPAGFSVSGSPVTSTGTLSLTLDAQSGRKVLAAPSDGTSGTPGFRALTGSDVPLFGGSGSSHAVGTVPDPGSTAGTTRYLREDGSWAIPPGSAGGSVAGSGTPGQIAFWSNTSTIAGDSAAWWDSTNHRLGVGTVSPRSQLDVISEGTSALPRGLYVGQFSSNTAGAIHLATKARGTAASPTAVASADVVGQFLAGAYDGTSYQYAASVDAVVDGSVSAGTAPLSLSLKTGTATNPSERVNISSGGVVTSSSQPGASAYNGSAQTLADNTFTALTFNTNDWAQGSATVHSTSSNTSRFTAPAAGVYEATCGVGFSTATSFAVTIRKNGSAALATQVANWSASPGVSGPLVATTFAKLAANDYVECIAIQVSGGSDTTLNSNGSTFGQLVKVW
jgi:hypothetical protein